MLIVVYALKDFITLIFSAVRKSELESFPPLFVCIYIHEGQITAQSGYIETLTQNAEINSLIGHYFACRNNFIPCVRAGISY